MQKEPLERIADALERLVAIFELDELVSDGAVPGDGDWDFANRIGRAVRDGAMQRAE